MNLWKYAFLLGICALLTTGCGTKKPAGIPPLYPATVTVKNGTSPIADASVFLVSQGNAPGSWAVNGSTDANGVAVINTSQGDWKSKGAPEGEYKIYITKVPDVKLDSPPEAIVNDSDALQKFEAEQMKKLKAAPKVIPDKLTNPAQSPLKITVVSGTPAELTVDLSEHK